MLAGLNDKIGVVGNVDAGDLVFIAVCICYNIEERKKGFGRMENDTCVVVASIRKGFWINEINLDKSRRMDGVFLSC